MPSRRRAVWWGTALFFLFVAPAESRGAVRPDRGATARNIVLFVADGGGFNAWLATAMWEGRVGRDVCDGPGWVRLASDVYPLRLGPDPGALAADAQDPSLVYDPARAWDGRPVQEPSGPYPVYFAGYRWLRRAPDSASTATAMSTGRRTYTGAINVDGAGRPVDATLARLARRSGRRVGIVTSVPWSHATPAALGGAHARWRESYEAIALEMLTAGDLDVIAGAGHPEYDENGRRIADPARRVYRYVGGERVWDVLVAARGGAPDAAPRALGEVARTPEAAEAALATWHLVEARRDIETLVTGPTPSRLLMVPQAGRPALHGDHGASPVDPGGTLQQARASSGDPRFTAPGDDPRLSTVPSLATLTRAALNALDDDPDGFFLHVEGGAVDWAMHENQLGRMIEEMMDFKQALETTVTWVEAHGGWEETLVLVTADHDHHLWGPRADAVPFDPLRDTGVGRLPGYRWLHNSHSNALVPLMARGPGAERVVERAVGKDPVRGAYLPQTAIYDIVREAMER